MRRLLSDLFFSNDFLFDPGFGSSGCSSCAELVVVAEEVPERRVENRFDPMFVSVETLLRTSRGSLISLHICLEDLASRSN
jgi:hypothetical protein